MKFYLQIIIAVVIFYLTSSVFANTASSSIIPQVVLNQNWTDNLTNTNSQTTVITAQQIQNSGATSLSEVLQGIGGIQLQDLTGDGSQVSVSMRGFGSNAAQNSLILINGQPLINPDIGTFNLNSIPVNTIEKIEIIQGSEGVLYGDQAVGGVINIITKIPQKKSVTLQAQYGSYNAEGLYAQAMNQFNNGLSYMVSANQTNTDNYRDHNSDDQNNIVGQINDVYSSGDVHVNYNFNQQHLLYAGALTLAQVLQDRRQAQNDTNYSNQDENFIYLTDNQNLNSLWQLQTNASLREDQGDGFLFAPFTQNRLVTTLQPKLTGTIANILVSTGLDGLFERYQYTSSPAGTIDNNTQESAYLQGLFPIGTYLTAITGARIANQDNTLNNAGANQNTQNQATATSLGFTYQINPYLQFYVRRDTNYRFPKADEIAFTALGINGLKTQTGVSYETGFKLQNNNNQTDVNIYQLDLTNELAYDPLQTAIQPFGANTNLPPTQRQGFIIQDQYKLYSWLLGTQYSYVNPRFLGGIYNGNQIPFVAKNVLKFSADYFITNNCDIYAETIYTGSEFAMDDNTNTAAKVPPFSVYNLALHYYYRRFSLALRINNISNKYYNYITTVESGSNTEYFYPAPGRNFVVTIGFKLW